MTWAQRLARVLKIDVTRCEHWGGLVRILTARNSAELHGPAPGPPQGGLVVGDARVPAAGA